MNPEKRKICTEETVIGINSVSKSFAARPVLDNINLGITRGQSVCICGVNGAGKTTLLRLISGLLQPDKGSLQLCGYNITKEPEKTKPQLGLISHKSMVYPDLTVSENLSFFANLYGVKNSSVRIRELLEDVGLLSYRYDKACILSRGLLQRLAIARALVHNPLLLLADEPFTGLDREASQYLVSVLNNFTANCGTVVMTTHDINTAIQCCGRIVVLDKTHVIFDALTSKLNTTSFSQDYLSYARGGK